MKTISHRTKLIQLIRTLDEAQTTWHKGAQGEGPRLMPSLYHEGSYQELEHRLAEMRDNPAQRTNWWHLCQRYRWGTLERTTLTYTVTRQGRRPHLPANTELIHQGNATAGHPPRINVTLYRHPPTDPDRINAALDHLATTMHGGNTTRIRLPLSLLYTTLGIAPPNERKAVA